MSKEVQSLDRRTGRIDFIDTAKGIGILLVILGHIVSLYSVIDLAIYSFHMLMFFIFSGLFANVDKYDFKPYVIRETQQLLLPYILFCLIIIVALPYKIIQVVGMANNYYGPDLFLFFLCAFCGTLLVLLTAAFLKNSRFLKYMGKNTLFIFSFHCIFTRLYSNVLTKIYNYKIRSTMESEYNTNNFWFCSNL